MFTVEPRNCDGFKETHGDDGASHSKLLQQLHHVGAALSRAFSLIGHLGLKQRVCYLYFQLGLRVRKKKLALVRVLREPRKQTTTKHRTKSSRLWYN